MNNYQKANPQAAAALQFLMRIALPLGIFFILEYMVSLLGAGNPLLAILRLPMSVITPLALFFVLRSLRDQILDGSIRGLQAWIYGVQLMLFASLIEAAWIYIYNEYLRPDALAEMQASAIAQYEQSMAALQTMPAVASSSLVNMMTDMMEQVRQTPVPTAIEAAVSQVSNDIFIGMLLMLFIAPMVKRKEPAANQ